MDKSNDSNNNNNIIDDNDRQELLWLWAGRISTEMMGRVREPLATIRAQVQLMERRLQIGGKVKREGFMTMLEQLDRMNEMMGGFWDPSAISPLCVQPVDVIELCSDTLLLLRAVFLRQDSQGRLEPTPEEAPLYDFRPRLLQTDPAKVRQILINLLCNSLEAGANRISISLRACGSALIIEVGDNGPGLQGISAEEAFEFGISTKPHRAGLGLPLSRRLAGRLGGDLSLLPSEQGCLMRLILADLEKLEELDTDI